MNTIPAKNPPKRCQYDTCKCKLGLTSFGCKCGLYFCEKHRYSEEHSCTFDYKEEQKKELLKHMSSPVIAQKIEVL